MSTRSALSDTEKREKKIVEKKLMEMEEELKVRDFFSRLSKMMIMANKITMSDGAEYTYVIYYNSMCVCKLCFDCCEVSCNVEVITR